MRLRQLFKLFRKQALSLTVLLICLALPQVAVGFAQALGRGTTDPADVTPRWSQFVTDTESSCLGLSDIDLACCRSQYDEYVAGASAETPPFSYTPSSCSPCYQAAENNPELIALGLDPATCCAEQASTACLEGTTYNVSCLEGLDFNAAACIPEEPEAEPLPQEPPAAATTTAVETPIYLVVSENKKINLLINLASQVANQSTETQGLSTTALVGGKLRLIQTKGLDQATPDNKAFAMVVPPSVLEEVSYKTDGGRISFLTDSAGAEQVRVQFTAPYYPQSVMDTLVVSRDQLTSINTQCAQAKDSQKEDEIKTCLKALDASTNPAGSLTSEFLLQLMAADGSTLQTYKIQMGTPIAQLEDGGSGCSIASQPTSPSSLVSLVILMVLFLGLKFRRRVITRRVITNRAD